MILIVVVDARHTCPCAECLKTKPNLSITSTSVVCAWRTFRGTTQSRCTDARPMAEMVVLGWQWIMISFLKQRKQSRNHPTNPKTHGRKWPDARKNRLHFGQIRVNVHQPLHHAVIPSLPLFYLSKSLREFAVMSHDGRSETWFLSVKYVPLKAKALQRIQQVCLSSQAWTVHQYEGEQCSQISTSSKLKGQDTLCDKA